MQTSTDKSAALNLPCLAPDDDCAPSWGVRLWVFPLIFIPWLVLYEGIVYRGARQRAFLTYLPGEIAWPVWQWMEILYVSPYVLVTLAPLLATSNRILRRFVLGAAVATIIINAIFLTVPAIATPRPFHARGLLGRMMTIDRYLDRNNGSASFPSFHVVWSFLAAAVFARRWPRWRWAWWMWAALVSASCVFTGMHSLADVGAGFVLFLLIYLIPARAVWRRTSTRSRAAPSSAG